MLKATLLDRRNQSEIDDYNKLHQEYVKVINPLHEDEIKNLEKSMFQGWEKFFENPILSIKVLDQEETLSDIISEKIQLKNLSKY